MAESSELVASLVIKALDRASGPLRQITGNFRALREGVEGFNRSAQRAANITLAAEGMQRFAEKAKAAIEGPIEAASSYQAALNQVTRIAGGSAAQMGELAEKAKQVSEAGIFSTLEVGQGMGELARQGMTVSEVMGAIPAVSRLAEWGVMGFGEAAASVSEMTKTFNLRADQSGHAVDVLGAAFRLAHTPVADLSNTLQIIGPQAAMLGYSLEDTTAMVVALGEAGLKGSHRLGGPLQGALDHLVNPSKEVTAALRNNNIQLVDQQGHVRALMPLLKDLGHLAAAKHMTQALRLDMLADVFGPESARYMGILMDKAASGRLDAITDQLRHAAHFGGKEDNTYALAMKQNANATEELNIALGSTLLPTLTEAKLKMAAVIKGTAEWTEHHRTLAKVLGFTALGVATLAGGLATLALGTAAAVAGWGYLQLAWGGISTAFALARGAVLLLNAALWANPAVLIGAAIVAAAAGIAYAAYEIYTHWAGVKAFFRDLWRDVLDGFKGAWDWIMARFVALGEFLEHPVAGLQKLLDMSRSTYAAAAGGQVAGTGSEISAADVVRAGPASPSPRAVVRATPGVWGFGDGGELGPVGRPVPRARAGAVAPLPAAGPVWGAGGELALARGTNSPLPPSQAEVSGTIHIRVDAEGRPRVRRLESHTPGVAFEVETGTVFAGAH